VVHFIARGRARAHPSKQESIRNGAAPAGRASRYDHGFLARGGVRGHRSGSRGGLRARRTTSRDRARDLGDRISRRRPFTRSRADWSLGSREAHVHRLRRHGARDGRTQLLVARVRAIHRGRRHRSRARRDLCHRVVERQVQRHGRGIRLGRHRSAHRRGDGFGNRGFSHRRQWCDRRFLGGNDICAARIPRADGTSPLAPRPTWARCKPLSPIPSPCRRSRASGALPQRREGDV
jgi:hypothetical protein